MFKKKNGTVHSNGVAIKGFYRVQIVDDKKGVVGDSGWKQNQVTDLGIRSYLVNWLTSSTGFAVTHMALGTGGAPASNATTLSGEVQVRQAVTSSIVASATAQFTAAFASANSFVTATSNISNVGLFCTSTKQSASLFAGNTFLVGCQVRNYLKELFKLLGSPVRYVSYNGMPIVA